MAMTAMAPMTTAAILPGSDSRLQRLRRRVRGTTSTRVSLGAAIGSAVRMSVML
jgi:hypothetical protein